MKRRDFLKSTSIAASTLAFPTLIPRHVLAADGQPGANDRLRVGFIGIGGRARWIISDEGLPGADLVAVADCDFQRVNKAAAELPGGDKWKK